MCSHIESVVHPTQLTNILLIAQTARFKTYIAAYEDRMVTLKRGSPGSPPI